MVESKKKVLEKRGYRMVGSHSAVKACLWTKKAIRGEDTCYKNKFYGIQSWRCVQMSCALDVCAHRCSYCWRDISWTTPKWHGATDAPEEIIEGCIKEHVKYLQGFGGNKKADKVRFHQALRPKHFAISLISESTFYPKLPELIDELHRRKLTSFLVTNGTNPAMLKKLMKHKPTQLYITLPAPNKEVYKKVCNPLIADGWEKINESLKLLKRFDRGTMRLTLVKEVNMVKPEQYAEILEKTRPDFVELKAYMHVGFSQGRLKMSNMPTHKEIMAFAKKISEITKLRIIDEKENSRVALLMEKDKKGRVMEFQ
jgi:tRNA wybutosine-synthesizing protein 1